MNGFYIQIKNNLLDPKHVKAMGGNNNTGTIWLFLWFIDKMTIINEEEGEGKVWGGRPIKFQDIKKDLGISRRTYNRWIKKLNNAGYIKTIRTPHGLQVIVYKAFKVFKQGCDAEGTSPNSSKNSDVPREAHQDNKSDKRCDIYGTSNIRQYTSKKKERKDKKKETLPSSKILHKQVTELFDYYKNLFLKNISSTPPIFNWGKCEKLAKPHISQLGLKRMKELLNYYLNSDDEFFKDNAYSLSCFLSVKILHQLNQKM